MALDFPASPSNGQSYTGPNGVVWVWDGTKWAVGTQSGGYVLKAGDTMTGALTIAPASGDTNFYLNKQASNGAYTNLLGQRGGLNRWTISLGDGAAESTGNAGSNFAIYQYTDAGAYLGTSLTINRATAAATLTGALNVTAGIASTGSVAAVFVDDRTTPGAANAWGWYVTGGVSRLRSTLAAADELTVDGAGNTVIRGSLTLGGNANPTLVVASGYTQVYAPDGSALNRGILVGGAAGGGYTQHRNTIHDFLSADGLQTWAYIDSGGTHNVSGAWLVISDPSVKQEVSPYTRGLDAVLALEPVQFRYAPGTPFATEDEPSRPLFGLMADQVKPHVPEIVGSTTARVRGVENVPLDTLEPGLLVFALINSVKELSARLAALEENLSR